MSDQDVEIINKHKNKDVLIDSNLLLLLVIGDYNPKIIQKYKRTCQFVEEDYYTLKYLLDLFGKIITTPNILTEVSNLSGSLEGKGKGECFLKFKGRINLLSEDFCPSTEAADCRHFPTIGLTDSVILKISQRKLLVLTEDATLTTILQHNNIDVINFNHIRIYNRK